MAKFKQGDRIRMVEDKDYVVTVEKVTKNGYELSNRANPVRRPKRKA